MRYQLKEYDMIFQTRPEKITINGRRNGKQIQDNILHGKANRIEYTCHSFGGMADIFADTENKSLLK